MKSTIKQRKKSNNNKWSLPSKQLVKSDIAEQIVEILQGLNASEEALLVGFMKYFPPASHWDELYGQHPQLDPEHGQFWEVQSWIAPKYKYTRKPWLEQP